MSKSSTIFEQVKVEQCAFCGAKVEALLVHLKLHTESHIQRIGEIIWLGKTEAIYKGVVYGKQGLIESRCNGRRFVTSRTNGRPVLCQQL